MTTTRFVAIVGVGWTPLCVAGVWLAWQDEEIPDDGGAVAAAWGRTFLVVAAWLARESSSR